jgi:peptidoglycan/LPS O-acetylase OafA/YrhL
MPPDTPAGSRSTGRIPRGIARVLAAAGLAVDAYLHAHLAGQYDTVTASVSQGTLFRVEAGLAGLAALLVLVWRRVPADFFAWLVAAGGLALLLVYRYVDVGAFGPFPNMYENVWYPEKTATVVAQAVAVLATVFLLLYRSRRARRRSHGRHAAR